MMRSLHVLIISMALIARLLPGTRTIDDAYITYRYAANIVAGNGFAYNPGEHVLGTTTPLYTFLLTGIAAFTGGNQAPFPQIALLINAIADAVTCSLLVLIGRRLGKPWAGAGAALAWAVAPFSVTFAIGGLETSLYVLLLTETAYAHLQEKRTAAAMLGALAVLTRPDALILVGPLMLNRLLQAVRVQWESWRRLPAVSSSRTPLRIPEMSAFGLPLVSWIIFSAVYFGSPLPHSVVAKTVAYRLEPTEAFVRLLQHYTTPMLEHLTFGTTWITAGLVLYPFLYLVGARNMLPNNRRSWPWLAYPWLYFFTFAAANPLIFRWYLTPPLPALIFGILAGVEVLVSRGLERRPVILKQAILAGFILLLPAASMLRGWTLSPDHGSNRPAPEMAYIQLELLYHQAAELLNSEIEDRIDQPVLAAGDVGVLGYTTGLPILDTVGLNTPVSTIYYPSDPNIYVINYAIPAALILDNQPDYLIILEVYGRKGLLPDEDFQAQYELLHRIPTDMYGSDGMLIFAQR